MVLCLPVFRAVPRGVDGPGAAQGVFFHLQLLGGSGPPGAAYCRPAGGIGTLGPLEPVAAPGPGDSAGGSAAVAPGASGAVLDELRPGPVHCGVGLYRAAGERLPGLPPGPGYAGAPDGPDAGIAPRVAPERLLPAAAPKQGQGLRVLLPARHPDGHPARDGPAHGLCGVPENFAALQQLSPAVMV